jgi:TatD DNase family protein
MASDAHAHPRDLSLREPDSEAVRLASGVRCAASSWNGEEFRYLERLAAAAEAAGGPAMVLCFGAHPQLPASDLGAARRAVALLGEFAAAGRLGAVGEAGFDLFDAGYRATEAEQTELFESQLEIARGADLPLVLHLRRAMHKAFSYSRDLARLPAVVLHSYPGTLREAEDLLKRGVNAYFSFGTTVALNHKRAMEACALLPLGRLLVETDAPYQPLRGRECSSWGDLRAVIAAVAALRAEAGRAGGAAAEVEAATDAAFSAAFGLDGGAPSAEGKSSARG